MRFPTQFSRVKHEKTEETNNDSVYPAPRAIRERLFLYLKVKNREFKKNYIAHFTQIAYGLEICEFNLLPSRCMRETNQFYYLASTCISKSVRKAN